jgi:hypothetical protein
MQNLTYLLTGGFYVNLIVALSFILFAIFRGHFILMINVIGNLYLFRNNDFFGNVYAAWFWLCFGCVLYNFVI